jgi:hypothetical protein
VRQLNARGLAQVIRRWGRRDGRYWRQQVGSGLRRMRHGEQHVVSGPGRRHARRGAAGRVRAEPQPASDRPHRRGRMRHRIRVAVRARKQAWVRPRPRGVGEGLRGWVAWAVEGREGVAFGRRARPWRTDPAVASPAGRGQSLTRTRKGRWVGGRGYQMGERVGEREATHEAGRHRAGAPHPGRVGVGVVVRTRVRGGGGGMAR